MTGGGAEINLEAAREVYLCEFEGVREVYSSVDQTIKVQTKKKSAVQKFSQILFVVSKFLQFSTNSLVQTKKKKKSAVQKFPQILVVVSNSSNFSRILK